MNKIALLNHSKCRKGYHYNSKTLLRISAFCSRIKHRLFVIMQRENHLRLKLMGFGVFFKLKICNLKNADTFATQRHTGIPLCTCIFYLGCLIFKASMLWTFY